MQERVTYTNITIIEKWEFSGCVETDGLREGAVMSWLDDWVEKESSRIRDQNDARDEEGQRKEEISSQSSSLWGSLQFWIKQGVERVNKTVILREQVGSDLVYSEISPNSF